MQVCGLRKTICPSGSNVFNNIMGVTFILTSFFSTPFGGNSDDPKGALPTRVPAVHGESARAALAPARPIAGVGGIRCANDIGSGTIIPSDYYTVSVMSSVINYLDAAICRDRHTLAVHSAAANFRSSRLYVTADGEQRNDFLKMASTIYSECLCLANSHRESAANCGPSTKARRQVRRGSWKNRHSHSRPARLAQRGEALTVPL